MIPKVRFNLMSLEDNIKVIEWIFNERKDVLDFLPGLKDIDSNLSEEEINKQIRDIVLKYYSIDDINNSIERYTTIWNKYNDSYFEMLSKYFNINFDKEYIDAYVGLISTFPRNIETSSFDLGINMDDEMVTRVIAHEVLHFYWFKKWMELYPDTRVEHLDAPYIEWKYSEMVTDPILNNKPFSDLFTFTEKGYDSFYIGDTMDKLRELYSKDIEIDVKIKEGYDIIRLGGKE